VIDWSHAGQALAGLYVSAKREKAWPPLVMFKALLLATWYVLSDVRLAEALNDRASFRRFCGFAREEETPERTAFVRFRRELAARGLDRSLFEAIVRNLEATGTCVRKGTIIDATIIGSATKGDGEAAWVKHRTRAPAHGYKAHIAADKDTGIIREASGMFGQLVCQSAHRLQSTIWRDSPLDMIGECDPYAAGLCREWKAPRF
jgi:IS5 family transposase